MRGRGGSRWIILLPLLAGFGSVGGAEPVRPAGDPDAFWRTLETFEGGRAEEALAAWGESDGRSRSWRFASAMHLLQRQPRTASNVAAALDLLRGLAAANDDVAVAAAYYVARIHDYHAFPPDRRRAAEEYRRVLERFPGRLAAEMGFASLAINTLFFEERDQPLGAVFDRLEVMLAGLRHPTARRAGHYVLADSALRLLDDRERALRHLEDFWGLQPRVYVIRADTLVKLGEINLSLGRAEAATRWYRTFLREFADEPRASWVEERLREAENAARKERG